MKEIYTEEKIKRYYPMIYRFVLIQLKNETEAWDVTQEVFYRYLIKQPSFDSEKQEQAWLFTVALNLCRNYWKSVWYRRVIFRESDEIEISSISLEEDEYKEESQCLVEAILRLPLKYRNIIHLYYYEEMSISEISRVTKRKESTIQTQLMRAREIIKKEWRN